MLGTRGRSGVAKFFLGSVAEEIFRQAPCPVLTVGPFTPGGPAWGGAITEIVYATDFSPESVAAAAHAISLAQEFQARLTLMHVIANEAPGDLLLPGELVKATEQHLRNLVPPEAELWCEPRFVVEQGSPAEKILEVAKHHSADLIVLGMHKPSGFPGADTHLPIAIAHKVISRAPCPVLTVRGQATEARRNSARAYCNVGRESVRVRLQQTAAPSSRQRTRGGRVRATIQAAGIDSFIQQLRAAGRVVGANASLHQLQR